MPSLALRQSHDCPSAIHETVKGMAKEGMREDIMVFASS